MYNKLNKNSIVYIHNDSYILHMNIFKSYKIRNLWKI